MDCSKYTLLVVDDVPLNVMLVSKMLSRYHFNLRTAFGGQEALDSISEQKPDIVILDLFMPDIDGFGVLRQIRDSNATKDIKVIIFSAFSSNDDIVKGFNEGADDFLTKPISMERLFTTVEKQVEKISTQAS